MILECVATGFTGCFIGFILGRITKKSTKKNKNDIHRLITSPLQSEHPHDNSYNTKTNTFDTSYINIFPSVPSIQPLPVPKNPPDPVLLASQQNI
tara:strand:- start:406 stop:690 length:285 start_codon:yes stop_codon:yes gene_type:complete